VEPVLGGDRQVVVRLATESGLLEALYTRLPPKLDPLARLTRTCNMELLDGDFKRQHWWSSNVT